MNKQLQIQRDKICFEIWEKYRTSLSMKDIGDMFNISTQSVYRIILEQKQKVENQKK